MGEAHKGVFLADETALMKMPRSEAVVGWKRTSKGIHILSLGTCECFMAEDPADVIKLSIMIQGDCLNYVVGTQCNHMYAYERKSRGEFDTQMRRRKCDQRGTDRSDVATSKEKLSCCQKLQEAKYRCSPSASSGSTALLVP